MRHQNALENLYDFKKEMMDVIPGIVRMTLDDCHGGIEQLVTDNIDKLEERHWKAVLDSKYNELFQDGIPHVSWNTDRGRLLNTLRKNAMDKRPGYEKISTDSWSETWYCVKVMYIKTPAGAVIKYKMEEPKAVSGSRHHYYGSVVPPEEVPEKATHTVVLLVPDAYGKVRIADQRTGTMRQCEEWLADRARDRGREMREVKFVRLGD